MAENAIVVAAQLAVLVAAVWQGAVAQSSSCTNALISMSPCLNYITGNSSTPSSSCCSQLASVVQSQPRCLCEVLNGGSSSLGINVNQTQALALPTSCNVQTPPISSCSGSSSGDSPSSTPTTPSGGNRSKTVPTTDGNSSSNANSTKFAFSLLVFLLFSASYASSSLAI